MRGERETSFMFELGQSYLVYLSALWRVRNHTVKIPPTTPTCSTGIPLSGTTYCGGFDQAVENVELSNFSTHSTSISIGGFPRQPEVHFRLWPTGPSVKTHVSAAIGYTTINHTLFAPLPGPQTAAKSPFLIICLPYPGDRPTNYPRSPVYATIMYQY